MTEPPPLTPLQRAIYETDQLELGLRESAKLVTTRVGFFVGQQKYVDERSKIAKLIAQYGPPLVAERDDDERALEVRASTPQVGSA